MGAQLEIGDNLLVLGLALIPTIGSAVTAIITWRRTRALEELKPNGGGSMRDQVASLHRVVVAHDRADDASDDPKVTIDKKQT